jgi:uncharacterized membrane protein YeaQ/YmgE (transglycosylase-associated protein family)
MGLAPFTLRQQDGCETERRADMGILSWIVFGLIAGAIAKFLMPGQDPGGCIITIIIGVIGAVLGGYLATMLGYGGISGFDFRSFVIAVIGSILLLIIWRLIRGRRVR